MGSNVSFEYITPRQFGELMYDLFGGVSPIDRESYVTALDHFYTYNNELNGRPFQVDMKPVLERIIKSVEIEVAPRLTVWLQ